MRIGFLGLGNMGSAMAANLLKVAIGDPFIEFLRNYEFLGQNEDPKQLAIAATFWHTLANECGNFNKLDSLFSIPGEKEECKDRRRDFLERYGRDVLKKLFLFCLETDGVTLSGGFNNDDIVGVWIDMDILILSFYLQNWDIGPKGGQIQMTVTGNQMGFYCDPKPSS